MAFSLAGLIVPRTTTPYVWWNDDAVDQAASDFDSWLRSGHDGLVFNEGATPARFMWTPLDRNVQKLCYRAAFPVLSADASTHSTDQRGVLWVNQPVIHYEAVAFGVVAVEGDIGLRFSRVVAPGGLRLEPDLLRAIGETQTSNGPTQLDMMSHLGEMILNAGSATGTEKKG